MAKIRARQFMIVQQVNKFKFNIDELSDRVAKLNAEEWAWIVHDKDKSENGGLVKPHVHLVLKFKNPQTLDQIAKKLDIDPQYIEVWKGRINNAYSYIIHLTENANEKHIYSPKEVKASFDFPKRIIKITNSVAKQVVNDALTLYSNGGISLEELKTKIGNLQYAKHLDVISKINKVLDIQAHTEWLKEFNGKSMTCHWYYGAAGTGKTRLAIKEAELSGQPYCILGSSNDYFQDYKSEDRIVILDELRPNDFRYGDLLKLMDPYQHDKHAPRRYHNVALNMERLIITTPYDPKTFYDMCRIRDKKVDTVKQLTRRISKTIHVTPALTRKELHKYGDN